MKALLEGRTGKYLLAFAGVILFLGLLPAQASAVKVSGTVTVEGAPAIGLDVVATRPAPNFGFLGQAQTDDNGNYTIRDLPTNTTILVFVDLSDTPFVPDPNDTVQKTVNLGTADEKGVDFLLVDGVPLSGIVSDDTNTPVPPGPDVKDEVVVFAADPTKNYKFLGQILTALDVTYTLLAAPGQTVEVAVDAQGTPWADLVVDPAARRSNLPAESTGLPDQNFVFKDGIIVQGTVTAANPGPVAGALVEAFDVDELLGWIWLGQALTDAEGEFSLKVLAELGAIVLRVTKDGFLEKRQEVTWPTDPAPDSVDVNIVLSDTVVSITGQVIEAGTELPIQGAYVAALQGTTLLADALTDANGAFALQVQADIGEVTVHVDGGDFYLDEPDQNVIVGAEDPDPLTFVLDPAPPPPPPPPPDTDTVTITKAVWSKGRLTVFATSSDQPDVVLTATVEKNGFSLTQQMTFSARRNQYELRARISTNLKGGTVTVTSSGGGSDTATVQ